MNATENVSISENSINNYDNNDPNQVRPPNNIILIVHILLKLFYIIVFIGGLYANFKVFDQLKRKPQQYNEPTKYYLYNLALSDVIYLLCIPFLIVKLSVDEWKVNVTVPFSIVDNWKVNVTTCKLYLYVNNAIRFTSSILICIICIFSYIITFHPALSVTYTTNHSMIVHKRIAYCTWTIVMILMLPIFIYGEIKDDNCNIMWSKINDFNIAKIFMLYSALLGHIIPMIFTSIFYYLLERKLENRQCNATHEFIIIDNINGRLITFITLFAYILCGLPFLLFQLSISIFQKGTNDDKYFGLYMELLTYVHSVWNPLMHTFFPNFLKKQIFRIRNNHVVNGQLHEYINLNPI